MTNAPQPSRLATLEPGITDRQAHWESRSSTFDADFAHAPIRIQVLSEVLSFLPKYTPVVLDAGTGTGRTLRHVLDSRPEGSLFVGMDLSTGMLRQARHEARMYHGKASFIGADQAALPFRSAAFDAVISTFTLHHIPPSLQLAVLKEFRRVLSPDGTLVLADQVQTDPALTPSEMNLLVASTFYPHLPLTDALARLSTYGEWPLTTRALVELMMEAGFQVQANQIHPIVVVLGARPIAAKVSERVTSPVRQLK